jgi:O-antigen/teichoic acid export membrane protein
LGLKGISALVQKSLKLFLLGLLLWPVFINLIGFISPFWAIFILEDGTRSDELLRFFQPYVPLVSIIFAMSLIFLSKVDSRLWIKITCWVASIFYVACSIRGFFPEEELTSYLLIETSYYLEILMLFLGVIILLRIFNNLTGFDRNIDGSV